MNQDQLYKTRPASLPSPKAVRGLLIGLAVLGTIFPLIAVFVGASWLCQIFPAKSEADAGQGIVIVIILIPIFLAVYGFDVAVTIHSLKRTPVREDTSRPK